MLKVLATYTVGSAQYRVVDRAIDFEVQSRRDGMAWEWRTRSNSLLACKREMFALESRDAADLAEWHASRAQASPERRPYRRD